MSFADPEQADPVQPEGEGQGGGGDAGTPYADYLNRIPEEVRGQVEPVFKDWDSNVTRRFQEASEYRKAWEPYEAAGVNQYDPDAVKWALEFHQAATQNPQAIKQWYLEQYGPQHGLLDEPQQQAPQQQDPFYQDPNGFQDPTAQQIEQILQQRLAPLEQKLGQYDQRWEQQEEQARIAEAQQYIQGQLGELKEKHPGEFTREAEGYVEALTSRYIDTDPLNAVPRAWADYQALKNQIQKSTLQEKVDQPKPPEGGGPPNAAPEPVKFADAGQLAREQLRAAMRGT